MISVPWTDGRTFVIAEIGCNHNGDLALAQSMIRAAAAAGADAAKFQSFVADELAVRSLPKAAYQRAATGDGESQFDRLSRVQLSPADHRALAAACADAGVMFASSPFDRVSARVLHECDVPFFKVPSGEITNLPLLADLAAYGRPVILSTGMADLSEVEAALAVLGPVRHRLALLHCTSAYPAAWEDANLRAMATLRDHFHVPVGLSDHTPDTGLAPIAVALGAVIIEKHFTTDRRLPGGDQQASLEPADFAGMVATIRRVEVALGDGIKRCRPAEEDVRLVARKSLVTRVAVAAGDTITADMIGIKRPGTGIPPSHHDDVIGRTVRRALDADVTLQWNDLTGDRR